ncbi:MAG: hypothetical protein H7256_03745 [Bdellovibrio sp.]|nr:hypothetical protein [Bdellovibrio sp.]
MKLLAALFIFGSSAHADVPYASLESLRQLTVVVRVASDLPRSKQVKACQVKSLDFAQLGSQLSLQTESAKADWQQISLKKNDLNEIRKKLKNCTGRGSCSVYSEFLSSAKSDPTTAKEIAGLKLSIDTRLRTLDADSYLQAWAEMKNPCSVLKSAL